MQDTFSNEGSELSVGLALVDEQVLTGLDEKQRSLRPLLLRPLTQTFSALIRRPRMRSTRPGRRRSTIRSRRASASSTRST
jgi:hypothetical protein